MALTYLNYLKVDDLLSLQQPRSNPEEHDEMLFIIIHQTYELWFKQILHEFEQLRIELKGGHTWNSIKTMRRILIIMKTVVGQTDILETMTPLSFSHFRGFLENASGFQSVQFREMETLCGWHTRRSLKLHEHDSGAYQILLRRMDEPTIWECFCKFLKTMNYEVEKPERVERDGLIFDPSESTQKILIDIMNNDPETALLCEHLVDFDEGLQEWRYRHVKMVERTIGTKNGTGGSDGVEYLKRTLHNPIFPDLWAIRKEL